MIKPQIKLQPLLITIFFFIIFITGLRYTNKHKNSRQQYQSKLSNIIYGTRRGIDPTPLPPEPPPNLLF